MRPARTSPGVSPEEHEAGIQRRSTHGVITRVRRLSSHGGQPLPRDVRDDMEARLGWDFSSVRIHDRLEAEMLSSGLQARAFTYGNQIFFNRNQYQPRTEGGHLLLMHELGHVMEQTSSVGPAADRPASRHPGQCDIQRAQFQVGSSGGFLTLDQVWRYMGSCVER